MKERLSWKGLVFVFLAVLLAAPLAHAQTAEVSGAVTDPSGAAVAGAAVTAVNTATSVERKAATNDVGLYSLTNLPPSVYTITFEKQGFKKAVFSAIGLTVDQKFTLNVSLEVGSVSVSVEVSEAAQAPVDLQDATISNVISKEEIPTLPLILRDPYQLILLSPGVIQTNSGLGGFSTNGTSERNNNFLLDGVDNNDTSVPGIASGLTAINPDSVLEFRVITNNYGAEYGRNNGSIIDAVTRSGTNDIHGDAYWFGRYHALGARDFFNHDPGTAKNPYVRNIFGASAGGPIFKNHTFWFANYEGDRFVTTLTNTVVVPTPQFKSGIFNFVDTADPNPATQVHQVDISTPASPNNRFGLPLSPTIQSILALYPNPTPGTPNPDPDPRDQARGLLRFPSASRTQADNFYVRMDQTLGSKNNLFARYAFNRFSDPNPFHDDILPGGLGAVSTLQRTQQAAIGLVSTPTSNFVNEFRFGGNRTNLPFNCTGVSIFDSFGPLDNFGRGPDYGLPSIQAFGCQVLGDSNGQARFTGTYQTWDNMSYAYKTHTFKWGAEFRAVYENGFDNFSSRAFLNFSNFSNFGVRALSNLPTSILNNTNLENEVHGLLGLVGEQSQTQFFDSANNPRSGDSIGLRQREVALYGEDSWKILSNLTITYGLRWEFYGVPFEVNNLLSNLFTNASGFAPFTFSVVGPSAGGSLYRSELRNFEPRIGIAWDPFKDGKTSVRVGYGIFRDRAFGNLVGNIRANPPFQQGFFTIPFDTIENVPPPAQLATSPVVQDEAGIFPVIIDPNFKTPYSQNWNFGVQRQFPWQLVVDVNYVGVKGNRLFRVVDGNPPQPNLVSQLVAFCSAPNAFGCTPATLQFTSLWFGGSDFGNIPFNAVNNNAFFQAALNKSIAQSTYQGLQINVQKHMSHGLRIQGAYTWSHAISNAADPLVPAEGNRSFPRNSFNLTAERGNSDNDIRHRGVINFTYDPQIGRGRGNLLSEGVVGRIFEGWELAGIVAMQTGHPYDVFGNRDSQHTGLSDRATLIGPPTSHGCKTNPQDKTCTGPAIAAFELTPFNQASNLQRNFFYGPGFKNFDAVISKNTSITERMKFQLRFEFYNLFNHPQFDQPGNNIASAGTFGVSTATIGRPDGTTSARQIQIGAKFIF